jgi:Tfp pilus assembly protein PilX
VATNTNFTPSSQLVTGIGLVVVCIVALLLLALFGIAVARVFTNIARNEPVALLPDQRLLQGGPTRVVDSTRADTDNP